MKYHLTFKEEFDLIKWRQGRGPEHIRRWIAQANAIHTNLFGHGMVVTSWFRSDNSFHMNGFAFDIRTRHLTNEDLFLFYDVLVTTGIPVVPIGIDFRAKDGGDRTVALRKSGQHLHVGEVATNNFEQKCVRDENGKPLPKRA